MRFLSLFASVCILVGCNFRPDIIGQDYSLIDDRIPVGTSGHVRHLGPSARIDALLAEQGWSSEYADQRPGLRLVADKINLAVGDHFLIGFINPGSDKICHPAPRAWDELERFMRGSR
jgi:hypothetical protein